MFLTVSKSMGQPVFQPITILCLHYIFKLNPIFTKLLSFHQIFLSPEELKHTTKTQQFCKTSILEQQNLQLYKKRYLALGNLRKFGVLVNFINQELKFCKLAQLFCEKNLRERDNFFFKKSRPISIQPETKVCIVGFCNILCIFSNR